jgi:hypothetical protein
MNGKNFLTVVLLIMGGLILGKQIAVLLKNQGVEILA